MCNGGRASLFFFFLFFFIKKKMSFEEDIETKKLQDKLGYADVNQKPPKPNTNTHITIKEPRPQRPIPALERKKSSLLSPPLERSDSFKGKEKEECFCQKKLDTAEDVKEMATRLYEMADRMLQSLSLDELKSSSTPSVTRRSGHHSPSEGYQRQRYNKSADVYPPKDRYSRVPPPIPYSAYYYPPPPPIPHPPLPSHLTAEYDSPPVDLYYIPKYPRRRKSVSHVPLDDNEDELYYRQLKRKNSARRLPHYDYYYDTYYYE